VLSARILTGHPGVLPVLQLAGNAFVNAEAADLLAAFASPFAWDCTKAIPGNGKLNHG
jgi:hypothetical protein